MVNRPDFFLFLLPKHQYEIDHGLAYTLYYFNYPYKYGKLQCDPHFTDMEKPPGAIKQLP